jgi:DNA replication protein DnaC
MGALTIKEIKKDFFDRIRRRRTAYETYVSAILSENPDIAAMNNEKNAPWFDVINGKLTEEEARVRSDAVLVEMRELLKQKKYTVDIFEYQPACKSCNDTGYINRRMCSCLSSFVFDRMSLTESRLGFENFNHFDINIFANEPNAEGISPRMEMIGNMAKAREFIDNFDRSGINLFFLGSVGSGKTFMSNCLAYELVMKGKQVITITSNNLVTKLTAGRFKDDEENQLFIDCDLLVIDDLGSERPTEFAESLLFNVVNDRLSQKKKMIITTNLSSKELKLMYKQRLFSRLVGNFDGVRFSSQDLRTLKTVKASRKTQKG